MADTGWTWAEVGRLTLPRLRALYDHYADHPPLHRMVAAYLGIKPRDKPTPAKPSAEASFEDFYNATMKMGL